MVKKNFQGFTGLIVYTGFYNFDLNLNPALCATATVRAENWPKLRPDIFGDISDLRFLVKKIIFGYKKYFFRIA